MMASIAASTSASLPCRGMATTVPKPGKSLTLFLSCALRLATVDKEEAGKGRGGSWEGFVIAQELYEEQGKTHNHAVEPGLASLRDQWPWPSFRC